MENNATKHQTCPGLFQVFFRLVVFRLTLHGRRRKTCHWHCLEPLDLWTLCAARDVAPYSELLLEPLVGYFAAECLYSIAKCRLTWIARQISSRFPSRNELLFILEGNLPLFPRKRTSKLGASVELDIVGLGGALCGCASCAKLGSLLQ